MNNAKEKMRYLLPLCLRHTAGREAVHGTRRIGAEEFETIGGFMKMRIVVSLLAFLTLCGKSCVCAGHRERRIFSRAIPTCVKIPLNTSGIDSFSLNEGSASFAYHIKDWLSAVGQIGAYHNGNILGSGAWTGNAHRNVCVWSRISYHSDRRITPFAQILFGGAHAGESIAGGTSGSQNAFAMTVEEEAWITGSITRLSLRPLQVGRLMDRFQRGDNQQSENREEFAGCPRASVVHFLNL